MDLSCYTLDTLRRNGEFLLCRGRLGASRDLFPPAVLVVMPVSEHPEPRCIRMLEHEWALRAQLDPTWALRPLALTQCRARPALVLEDSPGEPLDTSPAQVLQRSGPHGRPAMELPMLLRLAVNLARALTGMHGRGIIHKNINPAHILHQSQTGRVWLTGFGIASRVPRERHEAGPPETIAGTLAYMAPEQTGRMNRSVDARCDLYALGVTLYEMLTGSLPFSANDPMEWVHCHIARQAAAPGERVGRVPAAVSAIIMKLLEKTPEERYQTAAGLEHDLRRCQVQFEAEGRIDNFALGQHDMPDRLVIPEKLYGRAREIDVLRGAFSGIASGGVTELVLVSGHPGVGKSSVVNEIHQALVAPCGLFAAGKFDQYKRDIPYATVAQAFQGLVRQLLGKSEGELAPWREALREALGPNGQLMVDLVPELKLIVGDQPAVPELPPQDARRRFQLVFRRLLAVFARPEHPLALFLDDLQWLDAATLDLLEDLMTQSDVRHVLLIGAYRDNEVGCAHPLIRTLDAIRTAGARVHEIVMTPLICEDVCRLVADCLQCDCARVLPLATLVHEKTAGNPFFVTQFLSTLVEEALLVFDHGAARWVWDLSRIHAQGYTDNVADLMVDKLNRLPIGTRESLQQLACLGNSAEPVLLAVGREPLSELLDDSLHEALRAGLVLCTEGAYRFLHDRVQEAAYSLIPQDQRAAAHLRIGRLLLRLTPPEKQEEAIFEVVNQLNRGTSLIDSRVEKVRLAGLNLVAGKRAKASTAYVSALRYLAAATALLSEDGWSDEPELMFALQLHAAECEFLTGELTLAATRLALLAARATHPVDRASVAGLRSDLYTTSNQSDLAVGILLDYLHQLGIEWTCHPTEEEVRAEYEQMKSLMAGREIEALIDLPQMTDGEAVATLEVLIKALAPASFVDSNLYRRVVLRMVNLSLQRGNSDASCEAYVQIGRFAGPLFGNYRDGFRFGRLANDLVQQRGLRRFQARTAICYAIYTISSTAPLRMARELLHDAFDIAHGAGDLPYASFASHHGVSNMLAAGATLVETQHCAERGLQFAQQTRFGLMIDIFGTQLALVRTLRGLTANFGCFDSPQFNEADLERRLSSDPGLVFAAFWYWTRKTQARFLAGDLVAAVGAASNAQQVLWMATSFLDAAEAHFYGALSHAAAWGAAPAVERDEHVRALSSHFGQLAQWARNCPANFQDRALLVEAEMARIEGRELDAQRLFEKAIESAREAGFVHHEALANELAARFYAGRGFQTISRAYLRNARQGYLQWGADGKVRQLDRLHPHLGLEDAGAARTGTIEAPVEQLDLATVIKVSHAVSSEMVLEKLLVSLMRTAIEHAGAVSALLILARGGGHRIAAKANTSQNAVAVELCDEAVSGSILPETVLRYVLHTQQSVILEDAASPNPFSSDAHFGASRVRSVFCLPLANQGKLVGALYLENNLAPRVFAPARVAVLKMLASQAAISLENTRLYRELAEREARIRRLVDANIIGIFIWETEGRILEANDAFLTMVGYEREDVVAGRLSWRQITPPEWRDLDRHWLQQVKGSGTLHPIEKEYFRKDRSRVPVLLGAARLDETGGRGVAYVLDLTERRRAQEALNRASAELAHVSRVTALSALTASVTHEVNQPLAGIVTNASTCLRMLAADPPNIAGAMETARRTLRDSTRAADVIVRLRALFAKREFTDAPLDLNDAVREIVVLSSSHFGRNSIIVRLELADDLPIVTGDRIQLQQVILNLLTNGADAMAQVDDRPRELRITTRRDGADRVCLTVRDAGIGVSAQSADSLFSAFRTTKSGGMGIGLFVSRSIIDRHHGRLWAEPNEGAPGATFSFCVPIAGLEKQDLTVQCVGVPSIP